MSSFPSPTNPISSQLIGRSDNVNVWSNYFYFEKESFQIPKNGKETTENIVKEVAVAPGDEDKELDKEGV